MHLHKGNSVVLNDSANEISSVLAIGTWQSARSYQEDRKGIYSAILCTLLTKSRSSAMGNTVDCAGDMKRLRC